MSRDIADTMSAYINDMDDRLPIKLELMAKDIQFLNEKFENVHVEIREIKDMLTSHIDKEMKVWEAALDKKANRWVEKAVSLAIVAIVGAAAAFIWSKAINP